MDSRFLLRILTFVVLALFACVLSVVCVNGIFRCYQSLKPLWSEGDDLLYVDLYAKDIDSIPQNAMPGMTVLIDLGRQNLDTGVYTLQFENPPLKLKVPEVNEKYKIKSGEFADYVHTIRQSFLEIKKPSELVVVNKQSSVIDSDVKRIIIPEDAKDTTSLEIKSSANTSQYRIIKLANLSTQNCLLFYHNQIFTIKPHFTGEIFLSATNVTY